MVTGDGELQGDALPQNQDDQQQPWYVGETSPMDEADQAEEPESGQEGLSEGDAESEEAQSQESEPQTFTREQFEAAIEEQRRHFQSVADREVGRYQSALQQASQLIQAYQQREQAYLQELAQSDKELEERLEPDEALRRRLERLERNLANLGVAGYAAPQVWPQEAANAPPTAMPSSYQGQTPYEAQSGAVGSVADQQAALFELLKAHLREMGLDPDSPDIDWGHNASDPVQGVITWLKSVTSALQKSQAAAAQKALEAERAKLRREMGLDDTDTSGPSAPVGQTMLRSPAEEIAAAWR